MTDDSQLPAANDDCDDNAPWYRFRVHIWVKNGEEDALVAWLDLMTGDSMWIDDSGYVLFGERDDADAFVRVWGGILEAIPPVTLDDLRAQYLLATMDLTGPRH